MNARWAMRSMACAVAAAVAAGPAVARAEVGEPGGALALGGSLRILPAATYGYRLRVPANTPPEQVPAVAASLPERSAAAYTVLARLTASGRPRPWLSYEAHLLQEVTSASTRPDSLVLVQPTGSAARDRLVFGAWHWGDQGDVDARLQADRLAVKLALAGVDVTAGRQAITFGKAYFWNPLDVFRPFPALQLDRDYKAGVDALRIDVALGSFSGCTLVGVLGDARRRSWYSSAAVARAFTTWRAWDLTLQGGKIHGGYQVGGGSQGELGPFDLRAEASWFLPEREQRPANERELPEALSAVLGAGRRLDRTGVDVEYLYNGAGRVSLARAWPLVMEGLLPQASRHVIGAAVTHEATPLLKASLKTVVSLSDGSVLFQPGVAYSAADEVSLTAGAVLAFGERPVVELDAQGEPSLRYRSEFGSYPHVFYLESTFYF